MLMANEKKPNRDKCADSNLSILYRSIIQNAAPVTKAEKMRLFSKVLSSTLAELKGQERENLIVKLDTELLTVPEKFEPEAVLICRSYLNIAMAKVEKGTKVSTIIPVHGEQDSIMNVKGDCIARESHNIGDDDFFRVRIEQIKDLYAVNENFDWEVVLIADGDDRDPNNLKRQERTIDIAKRIAESEYSELYQQGKIRVLELSDEQKKQIKSEKAAAVCLGMRDALNNGADYIFFINAVPAYHAAQEGLLLQELLCGADMAIASRRATRSISKRSWLRELESSIYGCYTRILLPWIRGIADTQAGFKAFTKDSLEEVLPVDNSGKFIEDFDYSLSFDTDLISRYRILNRSVVQVPVARINFPKRISRVNSPLRVLKMVWGILKQRTIFIKRFKHRIDYDRFRIRDDGKVSYTYRVFPDENIIRVEGLSLHQGERSVIIIKKCDTEHNYINQYIPVTSASAIHGTIGYSALQSSDISAISTMEHLASAIKATGSHGLNISLHGAGCPMLDGSALAWLKIFEEAGWINEQALSNTAYHLEVPIILLRKSKRIIGVFKSLYSKLFRCRREGYDICPIKVIILPLDKGQNDSQYISVLTLPYLPRESMIAEFTYSSYDSYKQEIAPAKTFLPFPVWEQQNKGRFMGALPGRNILTLFSHRRDRFNQWTSKPQWDNEAARHKISDMIGDNYLTEAEIGEKVDIKGFFVGIGNGHRDNIEAGIMLKKLIDNAKVGVVRPLMANITCKGQLEYIDYDAKLVLKELRKLEAKGYLKSEICNTIKQKIIAKHQTPVPLKSRTLVKNSFLMSTLTALLPLLAILAGRTQLYSIPVAVILIPSIVLAWGALYHISQTVIFSLAKIAHNLNSIFGISTRLNYERLNYIKGKLDSAGAQKVIFTDKTNVQGLSCTTSEKKVSVSDWVLDDTDYHSYRSTKGLLALMIAGLNYVFKEAIVRFVILDYEKLKLLSWKSSEFMDRHSYILKPYQYFLNLIHRKNFRRNGFPESEKTEILLN